MPEKIGRYLITGELGKGAMGVVYKATDPNIGRTVALKTMRVDIHGADMKEMLSRFQNEARAAGVLNHTNIVTIYDAGEDQGIFYIAMAYIEGKTLGAVLEEKRVLTVDEVLNYGSQICAGLDYAHRRKIIHRDIKPANMMITDDGTLHIMDFGIAKAESGLTRTGEVLGTPNYMSPEQVKGRLLDGRSDLFSAGVILYEMVTGERPFTGTSITTIIYKIVHENPIPPRELDVTIHPGLSAVVTKALSKSPDERYQTGAELAEALRNYKSAGSATDPSMEMGTRVIPATAPIQPPTPIPIRGTSTTKTRQKAQATGSQTGPRTAAQLATDATATFDANMPMSADAAPRKSHSAAVMLGALAIVLLAAGAGIGRYIRHSKQQQVHATQEQVTAAQPTPVPAVTNTTPAGPESPQAAQSPQAPPAPTLPAVPTPEEIQKSVDQIKADTDKTVNDALRKAGIKTPLDGRLRITSNPSGAHVEIDGKAQPSVTPFSGLPLKAGSHVITVHLDGYSPATKSLDVAGGKRAEAAFDLAPLPAVYNITSTPPGAGILVDGVPNSQRTPAHLSLSPGQHKIVLHLEGYRNFEIAGDAGAGQTLNLAPVMRERNGSATAPPATAASGTNQPPQPGTAAGTPNGSSDAGNGGNPFSKIRRFFSSGQIPDGMGVLQVRTRPQGVKVTVDGAAKPRTTPMKFPILPGSHQVTLEKDGFQTVTKTVKVEVGKQLAIEETLPPK